MVDCSYLARQENRILGNPTQQEQQLFHLQQRMVLSHGHFGTSKKRESEQ
jgi:hypothetical protein